MPGLALSEQVALREPGERAPEVDPAVGAGSPGAGLPEPPLPDAEAAAAGVVVDAGPGSAETAVPLGKTVGPVNGAAMDASVAARLATGPPGKV